LTSIPTAVTNRGLITEAYYLCRLPYNRLRKTLDTAHE
jgi:hypothetical protein